MKLAAVALALSMCTPAPVPSPTPAPTPTVTVPFPPPLVDAGTPAAPDAGASVADCNRAYARQFALGCPPAEDAHFGWRDIDCPRLDFLKVACVTNSSNCAAARRCQE